MEITRARRGESAMVSITARTYARIADTGAKQEISTLDTTRFRALQLCLQNPYHVPPTEGTTMAAIRPDVK